MGLIIKGFVPFECIIDGGLQLKREKPPSCIPMFPQDRAPLTPKLLQMLECKVAMAVSLPLLETFVTFNEEPNLDLVYSGGCNS